jgi:hypothetical protein
MVYRKKIDGTGIKPIGDHDSVPRISVDVELFSTMKTLFASKAELLDSQTIPNPAA